MDRWHYSMDSCVHVGSIEGVHSRNTGICQYMIKDGFTKVA